MAGKRPFSSQAEKKNVQSMNGTIADRSTSTWRLPVKAGAGGGAEAKSGVSRLALAWA